MRRKLAIAKVCDWCGKEFEQLYGWAGTERFYCSGKCRAAGYAAEHVRMDWLLMRVLGKAYAVIEGAGMNFELEVRRSGFPGVKAVRAEWRQFAQWARRFEVDDVGSAVGSNEAKSVREGSGRQEAAGSGAKESRLMRNSNVQKV